MTKITLHQAPGFKIEIKQIVQHNGMMKLDRIYYIMVKSLITNSTRKEINAVKNCFKV